MKILVLGASGMAGHVISLLLSEKGYDITAFSRTPVDFCENIVGDAKDLVLLEDIISNKSFHYVINAIGILNEEADMNKADAVFLNSYLPHYISNLAHMNNAKMIHLSTDCVFSGSKGGYLETSVKDGKTFYDRSKALGEINNCKDLTFRNSIVGPDMRKKGIGLFNWFMKQEENVEGYANVFWSGVTTITLAKAIDCAISENLTGIYHLTNNTKISKYDLLKLFNKVCRNNQIEITKNTKHRTDKSLINTREDFAFVVLAYEEMIIEMMEWIRHKRKLYPHYDI